MVMTGDGVPIDLGSPTIRSLFAYLLLNRTHPSDRRRLAFIFWPRGTESAARRNLRQYLHRLRRSLDAVEHKGEVVLADGNQVQINPELEIWLDVEAFIHGTRPTAALAERQAAVSLYQGDLLEEFYEDWCLEVRQQLRKSYLSTLNRLSQTFLAAGNVDAALAYATRWVDADSLNEVAHRQLMTLYARMGDRSRALQQFQDLRARMVDELGSEPSPNTQALYNAILEDRFQPGENLLPASDPAVVMVAPPEYPLIGRERELDRLQAIQEVCREGLGRFVLITGESGIGKTRLIREYLTLHPEASALQVVCNETEAMIPYSPLRQILHALVDGLPESSVNTPPQWMAAISHLLPVAAGETLSGNWMTAAVEDRVRFADTLMQLFASLSETASSRPLHLIVDDLQWADDPTWDFLTHLARHIAGLPLLLVGLCRLEDLPPDRAGRVRALRRNNLLRQIVLERLTLHQTNRLAAHLMPDHNSNPIFLHRLYQETEGIPFFIIETVRALLETGRPLKLGRDLLPPDQAFRLPLSIQRVIENRLDRLSPESQTLLATAATIGRAFTLPLLGEVSRMPTERVVRHMEDWVQRGLIREGKRDYDFSHAKIRQIAYGGLSRARRQLLHRRVAEVLERAIPIVDSATLAHHYARSDQPLNALPYFTRAGEQALRVRSYHEAKQLGSQAISLLGRMPGPRQREERVDLNLQLAQAHAFSGDLGRAQEILSETEHLARSLQVGARLGNVFHRSAQIFWLRGKPLVAGDYARRALRVAEEQKDPVLLKASLRMLGRISIALSAFDDAIAYLLRYSNLEKGNPPSLEMPILLGYLGVAYARVGAWKRAFDMAQQGVELAAVGGSAQMVAVAGMQLAYIHGDYFQWQPCLEVLDTVSDPQVSGRSLMPHDFMLLGVRGRALGHMGHTEEGIKTIRTALAWARDADHRVFHYLPRLYLAECLAHSGDLEAARQEAQQVLKEANQADNRWASGVTLRLLAEVRSHGPNPDWTQVERYLIDSMHILRQIRARPDLARTFLSMRRLYDRAGQIAWAVDCHFRATTIFDELGMLEELRQAQGQAAGDHRGAVVIPDMALVGPNHPASGVYEGGKAYG